ncbi:MAG: tetratricopeptide repeat protein [Lachnospiraceae bacterium]
MNCYNCGCRLSEKDYCTGCGADVSLYKRIVHVSNMFYNEGLAKANVRDLSGAITSLRQSLKFNKNNIKARNLLGLVYFEMGEVVAALSEWVISKNIRSDKNIADDYINAIQANPSRLETINQTIKKYNQALDYCHQDSLDLAVIQLKKVLSLNPKFVRAHQLLALLYIQAEEWDKAKRELDKCCKIDGNNTTTLRYLKEVNNTVLTEEEKNSSNKNRKKQDEAIQYRSGNETIIQPMNIKEQSGFQTLWNIVIGAVIGLAIAWFLILPARIQGAKADIDKELKAVSETSDVKSSTIEELNQKITDLTEEITTLKTRVASYEGTDGTMKASDNLIKAANLYLQNPEDATKIADSLGQIEDTALGANATPEFTALYTTLMKEVGTKVSASYYKTGYAAYKQGNYSLAITDLKKSSEFDETNADALYNLANAYRKNGDKEDAITTYRKVMQLFEGTEKAKKSEDSIAEMKAES